MKQHEMKFDLLHPLKAGYMPALLACTLILPGLLQSATLSAEEAAPAEKTAMTVITPLEQTEAAPVAAEPVVNTPRKPRANQRGDSQNFHIQKLEFKKAKLIDVMRTISEISDINIVPTQEAGEKEVTIYLRNVTVHEAIDTISRSNGLWYRQDKVSKAYRVMTAKEFQDDVVVFRDDVTQIFNLLHPNPVIVAQAIEDLYGSRVILSLGVQADDFNTGTAGSGGTSARSGQSSLRRSTSSNRNNRGGIGGGRAGTGGRTQVSEQAVTEEMTPERIAQLEKAITAADGSTVVSSDDLKSVSRTEQPIYVTVNREHNLIIVRTSDTGVLRDIERLIKEMDRPTTQVLLEMKILELTIGDSFNQLFNFEYLSGSGKEYFGLGNAAIPTQAGSFIYSFLDSQISARLELLQKNNQINTLSSPILLASNNRPARVFVGEERILVTGVTATDPVISSVGTVITPGRVTYETELRDIGNTLNIVPKINADGTVTLSIQQDVSSVLPGAISLPPITIGNTIQSFNIDSVKVANIEGIVVAKDGLTVAIGGLISNSSSYNETKVPLLGDIPLVGELFKKKDKTNTKSEMILLITPRIIKNPSDGELVTADTMDEVSDQAW
jgi:general secretion pathway protein D